MNAKDTMTTNTSTAPGTPQADGRYDRGMLDESTATPPVPATLTLDGNGRASYAGLPVSMSADGSPLVHVSAGAMSIETVRSLGIDLDQERLLYASRARMGGAV